MNRRYFLITCSVAPLIILPGPSNAFLVPLLRFLFTGLIRGVVATVATGVVTKMVSARSLGISHGSVMEVSPNVAQQTHDNGCKAIFLTNAENLVTVQGNTRFASNLTYAVEDVNSNANEIERMIYASSSGPDFSFTFPISELPFTGVKRLVGTPHDSSYERFYSPNFVIADAQDVILYEQS